ncbi:MAG: ChaN family lipoprotein [Bdellovibrio sp.]|nr:ChaN family lipoprotein [Bdellovibrio sp.]
MRNPSFLLFITTFFSFLTLNAQIYQGTTLQEATLQQALTDVQPGSIVILGESHGMVAHQAQHMLILNQLRKQSLSVSVGLEFLNYPDQAIVDQYVAGTLNETNFLAKVAWQQGFNFDFYKQQLLFPEASRGEFSIALNLPRAISSKISKMGIESLTESELQMLPPDFKVGRDSYKERFAAAAGAHCPSLDRCFMAQSSWDDTMAWTAVQFLKQHPEQVLVIVVGEFHAQFGGGLAWRIHQRQPTISIRTISQIWAEGYTNEDIQAEMQPSLVEGPRADFIWISKPSLFN